MRYTFTHQGGGLFTATKTVTTEFRVLPGTGEIRMDRIENARELSLELMGEIYERSSELLDMMERGGDFLIQRGIEQIQRWEKTE